MDEVIKMRITEGLKVIRLQEVSNETAE